MEGKQKNIKILFAVALSPRSITISLDMLGRAMRYFTGVKVNFMPIWCPLWTHCLRHDFTRLAKLALEKTN